MRKYHLSALNLFWGLSPLSSQCSGSLCDNTNAETQTGNNSSPIGGPSDFGVASLQHTKTPLSLSPRLQMGENKRECHVQNKKKKPKKTNTHISYTLQSVPPPIVEEWAAVVPLVYRHPTRGKTASWHAL